MRNPEYTQSPPHAIEVEQALIGAILINNDGYGAVMGRIKPEHFFEPVHARIYEQVAKLLAAGQTASPVTLAQWFRDDESLRPVGGVTYLARLAASATTVVNAPAYAEVILDAWVRREGLMVLRDLQADLTAPGDDAADKIKAALNQIAEIAEPPSGSRVSISASVGGVLERINDFFQSGKVVKEGVSTGSLDLDKQVGFLVRGEFVVLGARPSMGKTTVALSLMLRAAKRGAGVLYFSHEMKAARLAERALSELSWSSTSKIPYRNIAHGNLTDAEFRLLLDTRETFAALPLIIDERPKLSMMQIKAAALREKRRFETIGKRLDVIVIDHMGLVLPSQNYRGNKVAETEEISGDCKVLAKELDCCVIALLQLNRALEGRPDKRPQLSDLRWSGAIEQDGDVVAFVYRDAYYLEREHPEDQAAQLERDDKLRDSVHKLELIIAKNREGPTNTIEMYTDMACGVVRDLDRIHPIGDIPDAFI